MSVLIDDPIWLWRDQRWAHLASDVSADELHEFARELGLRRLAFQGDHYDVPASLRTRAIALGAAPVSSRELVRRLRAAGLRRRAAGVAWRRVLVADAPAVTDLDGLLARSFEAGPATRLAAAARVVFGASEHAPIAVMGFAAEDRAALALEVVGGPWVPTLDGVVDELHVTPRATSTLVELVVNC